MNEIRRVDRAADEIARIRGVVSRHALPEFVAGFDVELGEFDDEPAMWIIFHLTGERPAAWEDRRARAETMRQTIHALTMELYETGEGRYPYFRLTRTDQDAPSAS